MKKLNLKSTTDTRSSVSAGGAPPVAPGATGGAPPAGGRGASSAPAPDPEVFENKPRRRFTAKYKLRILQEAEACKEPGQIGALLRREGLYSSNLTTWRKQQKKGLLAALGPKKRGRKPVPKNPLADRVAQLERENRQLTEKLRKAETIIDVQKKISEILGINQNCHESERSGS
jgi:transposase